MSGIKFGDRDDNQCIVLFSLEDLFPLLSKCVEVTVTG